VRWWEAEKLRSWEVGKVGWWEVRKLIKMAEFLNSEVGMRKSEKGKRTEDR
jgi:hypothetical protein